MEKVVINAEKRDVVGKKVGSLRRQGLIPGVMYGHNEPPFPITMNAREIERVINNLTSSSIVTVKVNGESHQALIREKQKDYIRNQIIHIDFQILSLKEKIRSKIEVKLVGVAPAVKNFNGIVLQEREFIDVEALPADLPERITVDISGLENIGDLIRVGDLDISDAVTVFDDVNDVIVSISGAMAEEAVEEEVTTAEGTEPEVVEKGKKESEEEEEKK
ncbi:MAG TPA: 50S ribosomal protein L25 [Flexilinea sp.]|jgi:large subunit ribosomal protein L25|nr:50S ribosomal protein L25 [Flexilinea sp.]OQA24994.1 MAG: General stress protein CTC [Chloroflexi bacterium ADurb.Bin344]HNY94757.1 50S ribosomal protein L25 [Flexilinea sp.]HOG21197.1 50S ribosomal protein L25 [Flexilinea sp.]HOG59887.1 50S ribosomal protein L25 [Flexilinea sp.]